MSRILEKASTTCRWLVIVALVSSCSAASPQNVETAAVEAYSPTTISPATATTANVSPRTTDKEGTPATKSPADLSAANAPDATATDEHGFEVSTHAVYRVGRVVEDELGWVAHLDGGVFRSPDGLTWIPVEVGSDVGVASSLDRSDGQPSDAYDPQLRSLPEGATSGTLSIFPNSGGFLYEQRSDDGSAGRAWIARQDGPWLEFPTTKDTFRYEPLLASDEYVVLIKRRPSTPALVKIPFADLESF